MRVYALITLMIFIFSCTQSKEVGKMKDKDSSYVKDYDPEARLVELEIQLSKPSPPVANYVNMVRVGNLIFLSGKGA